MDFDAPVAYSKLVMHAAELVAAYLLVGLFVVGLIDFGVLALNLVREGRITDPRTLIELLDIVLLLFIVAEIYQTVIAYVESEAEVQVVRAVVYAGIIAIVRKAITFQTDAFPTYDAAVTAAVAYTLLLVGLAFTLFVSGRYGR
ncbi:phosphate-starvation-inducible PsiE family protein [Haladaptatus sp. DFWS20]|uniref:phosphate-starvation-inducible PsiE family protein n=1 Tax=Haladaptatus sp. DFWS20 TaxID=3403467 RepID=UPI003EBC3CC9